MKSLKYRIQFNKLKKDFNYKDIKNNKLNIIDIKFIYKNIFEKFHLNLILIIMNVFQQLLN